MAQCVAIPIITALTSTGCQTSCGGHITKLKLQTPCCLEQKTVLYQIGQFPQFRHSRGGIKEQIRDNNGVRRKGAFLKGQIEGLPFKHTYQDP